MGQPLALKRQQIQKINTATNDVLLTFSQSILLFMGGKTVPTAASAWQIIPPPLMIVPKGVGAYIMGGSTDGAVVGAAFDPVGDNETVVFPAP